VSLALALLLGAFAVGAGWHIHSFQEQKRESDVIIAPKTPTATSTSSSKTIAMCQKELVFCTMEYRPSQCQWKSQGQNARIWKASGENPCQARHALYRELCAGGQTTLTEAQTEEIVCIPSDN
jgi:hypothetical protein